MEMYALINEAACFISDTGFVSGLQCYKLHLLTEPVWRCQLPFLLNERFAKTSDHYKQNGNKQAITHTLKKIY